MIADTVAKVKAAGLDLYAGGVIYMKSEAEVDRAFAYSKAAGFKMIIGVPTYELLPYTNKKVQEYDIPSPSTITGPTTRSSRRRRAPTSGLRRWIAAWASAWTPATRSARAWIPSESAEKYFDRLLDVHIKDTSEASAKGTTVEIGRGVIDIPKLLKTLKRLGYKGTLALEYKKDAKDPLPGSAESIGYLGGVIAALA